MTGKLKRNSQSFIGYLQGTNCKVCRPNGYGICSTVVSGGSSSITLHVESTCTYHKVVN